MQQTLDSETLELLTRNSFDRELFSQLRERMLRGELSVEHNRVRGALSVPEASDVARLPEPGSSEHARLTELGSAAIARGEVGCVVLAGGMATRFGGVVKAAVPVLGPRSFLALKIADIRLAAERAGGRVPVLLMSSFATHQTLLELVRAEQSERTPIEVFPQFISLRLTPDGELFRGGDGRPSPYAPGHGDMSFALRASGALARFRQAGGRVLAMSNVDNLGATLDPAVIGAHLAAQKEVTVEVVRRDPGEPGGAPVRLDGRLQIVEDFRFPESLAPSSIPYFNTNTLMFDAAAIDRDFALTWFLVRKRVEGHEVVQFEHLVGELTAFLSCACLEVPRRGTQGRFQPAKDPEELAQRLPDIEAILRARGVT
jgi:UTP--glucose-1-phosphate uridylyltransferase